MTAKRKMGGSRRPAATAAPAPARADAPRDASAHAAVASPPSRSYRTPILVVLFVVTIAGLATGAWMYDKHRFDMVRTLAEIAKNEGAWDNPWDLPNQKIASLQAEIAQTTDPIRRLVLRRELGLQYLYGGSSEPAIATLEQILVDYKPMLPPRDVETVKGDIALAYLRLGELSNCTWNHNSDACIFPIAPDGFHKEQLGAREAAARYTELLAEPGTDADNALVYRWLL